MQLFDYLIEYFQYDFTFYLCYIFLRCRLLWELCRVCCRMDVCECGTDFLSGAADSLDILPGLYPVVLQVV